MTDQELEHLHQQAERIRQAIEDALDIDARMSAWEIAELVGINEATALRHLARINAKEHAA